MPRVAKAITPTKTTSQTLASLLKSARDIMRKDKGLNGDLDRLPMLTWLMFLKFLDDLETQREAEAKMAGKKFKAAIEAPYRWRDWAADPQGITGDELLAFINQDETQLATSKRGPGLFAYLRGLSSSNGDNRRDVIATVFKGVDNRMKSGYLLRDVVNRVAAIHFTSSEELHTLGALYESMLREMRDAAGDSGEFYTPRAVVRLMVKLTNPRLGERVLDPAAGTGGFLVEAYNHLSQQVKSVQDRAALQGGSLFGGEPKSLPYLLCQMNLLLHGLDTPNIDPGNSLRFKLTEIGESDRVDVVLTNPPFGGEEEKGIQGNFPEDRQTAETALLFLQLIMRKLRRHGKGGRPARAAVIVPNGTLFGDGVAARIKEELLQEFNLHTVVRLPEGVFAPYTGIPTNILFFDRSGPTKQVWYYEQPYREGVNRYSRSKPFTYEEFAGLLEWWNKRQPTPNAWCVPVETITEDGMNLDQRNPATGQVGLLESPRAILERLSKEHEDTKAILGELSKTLGQAGGAAKPQSWPLVPIGQLLTYLDERVKLADDETYTTITVKRRNGGLEAREENLGSEIKTKKQFKLIPGAFILSRVQCWHQAFAVVPENIPDNMIASTNYDQFQITGDVNPKFFWWLSHTGVFLATVRKSAVGVVVEKMVFDREKWFKQHLPIPPRKEQDRVVALLGRVHALASAQAKIVQDSEALVPSALDAWLAGTLKLT